MPMATWEDGSIARRDLARQAKIADALGATGFALPGTVLVRSYPCGKSNCRCHAEEPKLHGPYIQWSRKLEQKTVTERLSDEEWRRYKRWFDNARRLRALLSELEELSLRIFEDQR
jgi:hypothetical protein